MALITNNYKLDLKPDLTNILVVHCGYYDTSRHIIFTLYSDGVLWTIPNGVTARVEGTKIGKKYFSIDIQTGKNTVEFDLIDSMDDAVGTANCAVIFMDSNKKEVASAAFILQVAPTGIVDTLDLTKTDFHHYLKVVEGLRDETKSYRDEAEKSADRSARSASDAVTAKNAAETAEKNAKTSEQHAKTSETNAKNSENAAANSANLAKNSENIAKGYIDTAKTYRDQSQTNANTAKAWAVGPNGSGVGTDKYNAKYFAEQIHLELDAITNIDSLLPCSDEEMQEMMDMFTA